MSEGCPPKPWRRMGNQNLNLQTLLRSYGWRPVGHSCKAVTAEASQSTPQYKERLSAIAVYNRGG